MRIQGPIFPFLNPQSLELDDFGDSKSRLPSNSLISESCDLSYPSNGANPTSTPETGNPTVTPAPNDSENPPAENPQTQTETPINSITPSMPSSTATSSATNLAATSTIEPIATTTLAPTVAVPPTATSSPVPPPIATNTPIEISTVTSTSTQTVTATYTPTETSTATPTPTETPTATNTVSGSSHLIFISTTTTGSNIGGLAGADAICQGRASDENFPGTWLALLSDSSTAANSRVTFTGRISNLREVIANDSADLWDGTLLNQIRYNEEGNTGNTDAWTGSLSDGSYAPDNCNDWLVVNGDSGQYGSATGTDATWIDNGFTNCFAVHSVYCVSTTPIIVHIIFTTNSFHPGSIGGVAAANTICQNAADTASLGGTWRAILSDSGTDARDNITISGNIFSTGGEFIASDSSDLWDGTISSALVRDENGDFQGGAVWTGTDQSGVARSDNCSDWTSTSGGVNGTQGDMTASNSSWITTGTAACSGSGRIYCVSQ